VLTRAADAYEFLAHGREFSIQTNREIYSKPRRKQSRIEPDRNRNGWRTRPACRFGRLAQTFVSHALSDFGARKFVGRDFRRAAENRTPAACAPRAAAPHPTSTSEVGFISTRGQVASERGSQPRKRGTPNRTRITDTQYSRSRKNFSLAGGPVWPLSMKV
jgi:hypothetical protein